MAEDESKRYIDELLSLAGNPRCINDPVLTNRYLGLASAKLSLESNELAKRSQELTKKSVEASEDANALSVKLLRSNEQANRMN